VNTVLFVKIIITGPHNMLKISPTWLTCLHSNYDLNTLQLT